MNESEIGYRGSKSELKFSVKEQRVDGSYCIKAKSKQMQLRCTLMGFERNYQIRILSNKLNKLNFSTISDNPSQLNPYFVTGFSDAEASFQVLVFKNQNSISRSAEGWSVRSVFTIGLHSRDLALLLRIKSFFGCGIIIKNEGQK